MLHQVVVFCALLAASAAFVEIHPLLPKPEKFKGQPGCYIKELDVVLPLGEKVPSKERCVEYRCFEDEISVFGCGVISVPSTCKLVEETELPYPACCPRAEC